MVRWVCLASFLVGAGCHSLSVPSRGPTVESSRTLWEKGQEAMRQGKPDQAVALYQQSLGKDENETRNHLSLAAAHMAQGNEGGACLHLTHFLAANPDHANAR